MSIRVRGGVGFTIVNVFEVTTCLNNNVENPNFNELLSFILPQHGLNQCTVSFIIVHLDNICDK